MTFDGTISRQDQKLLGAAMTVFAGALMNGWILTASTVAMGASLFKMTSHALDAATVACAGAMMRGWLFTASTVAGSAEFTKETIKGSFDAATVAIDVVFNAAHTVIQAFTAATVAMAGSIVKAIDKFFNAS